MGWENNSSLSKKKDVINDILSSMKKEGSSYYVKALTEDCGPVIYDCPERFLKYECNTLGYSQNWRDNVKNYHDTRRLDLVGQHVLLFNRHYKVLSKNKRSYIVECQKTKERFKASIMDINKSKVLEKENLKDKVSILK